MGALSCPAQPMRLARITPRALRRDRATSKTRTTMEAPAMRFPPGAPKRQARRHASHRSQPHQNNFIGTVPPEGSHTDIILRGAVNKCSCLAAVDEVRTVSS